MRFRLYLWSFFAAAALCFIGSRILNAQGVPPPASGQDAVADGGAGAAPPHVLFKKVPVDGSLDSFVGQLSAAGLSYIGMRDGIGCLEGTFAGVSGARVFAFASGGVTWRVVVELPGNENWTSMKKQYLFFKQAFTAKYLCEPRSVERFPNYCREGSGREHNAFKDETAVWSSSFSVPNGTAVISVQPSMSGPGRMFLRIEYVDELNSMLRDNEAMEDI